MHLEALDELGKDIFCRLKLFKGFYLVGGTALALQTGHRISVDFDLFSPKAEILKLAEKKYGEEFSGRLFLEQLTYLEDVKEGGLIFLKDKGGVAKNEILRFFESEIEKLKI